MKFKLDNKRILFKVCGKKIKDVYSRANFFKYMHSFLIIYLFPWAFWRPPHMHAFQNVFPKINWSFNTIFNKHFEVRSCGHHLETLKQSPKSSVIGLIFPINFKSFAVVIETSKLFKFCYFLVSFKCLVLFGTCIFFFFILIWFFQSPTLVCFWISFVRLSWMSIA